MYVGLRAAETAAGDAQLALEELKRTGAFERSALIVITHGNGLGRSGGNGQRRISA